MLLCFTVPVQGDDTAKAAVAAAQPTAAAETDRALALFHDAMDSLRTNYVGPVDEVALTETALKAMLATLDGHSTYLTPKEFKSFGENAKGVFGGVGAVVEVAGGGPRIISPVDGGPLARLGVGPGWKIMQIDGVETAGLILNDVTSKLRGTPGTKVTVIFSDLKNKPVTMEITRELINIQSVYQRSIGTTGYLRVTGFDQKTGKEFTEAAKAMAKSKGLTGVIIDLRNNAGGFLDSAILMSSALLKKGDLIVRGGKSAADSGAATVQTDGDVFNGLPIVLLINSGSASASEVVAGALQDNHRATLVGLPSFGKGLVQTVFPLDKGERGAVIVTTMRYYSPSGRSIQKTGILPDLIAARNAEEARQTVDADVIFSEATLAHAPDNETGEKRQMVDKVEGPLPGSGPEKPSPLFAAPLPSDADVAADFQIQRALDVLKFGSVAVAQKERPAQIFLRKTTPADATPLAH